jgi:protein-disulfide isomerase
VPAPEVIQAVDSVVDISGMPAQGAPSATLVLIEFLDFECPYCKQHANTVRGDIRKAFVDSGRLKYVVANYPLDMHASAKLMAGAAICANEQGRFWDMHGRLFETQPSTAAFVLTLAQELDMANGRFQECMEARTTQAIARDAAVAQALGVKSTPSFALGAVERDGRVRVSSLIRGAQPLAAFEQAIDALLDKNASRPAADTVRQVSTSEM